LKPFGYFLSIVGICLLAWVSLLNASTDLQYKLVIVGLVLSIVGTVIRLMVHIRKDNNARS